MMTALAADKLQEAIFDVLSNDTALLAAVKGGYDEPPSEAEFPYWSLGSTAMTGAGTKSHDIVKVSFDIDVWSRDSSQMEAKEILSLIDAAFESSNVASDEIQILSLTLLTASVIRQIDETGAFYRGRMSYRSELIQEN